MNKNIIIGITILFIMSFACFAGSCQINQPIGQSCYETVRLVNSCEYVDIYYNNTFYDQAILTFNHGFYYYDYSLNIKDPGNYFLRFCDDVTYSIINMFYSNVSDIDIVNITILYPDADAVINSPDIEFTYNISPFNVINNSNYLYSKVLLFNKGLSYANFTDNTSINNNIKAYDIESGEYQYYIMIFYNGGNVTSGLQFFKTTYTTDKDAITKFNTLNFNDWLLLSVLIFAYLGILAIGLYFQNPAFQTLAMIIGIGCGIFLIRVNILLGIIIIVFNIFAAVLLSLKE